MILELAKTPANARELLATAEALGHPPTVVESTDFGFRVPDDVGLAVLAPPQPKPKSLSKPRSRPTAKKE